MIYKTFKKWYIFMHYLGINNVTIKIRKREDVDYV